MPDGEIFHAAHAVFRALACIPGRRSMLWMYETIPGFAVISEATYRLVAKRRPVFLKLTHFLWGRSLLPPSCIFTRWVFLRLLGIIYLAAFLSLSSQVLGLVGSHGVLPAGLFMRAAKESLGADRYWLFPSLTWLNSSDGFLRGLIMGGAFLSVLLIVGVASFPVLILLWTFYLSLVIAGQDFMMFQWDGLLLETGFLAIFLAPRQILPKLG